MKGNRLFGIIYLLMANDSITARKLADYFEVSVRTIYRDIDLLSTLNIPIYASKGKNGGISLLDNYKLDKTLLTAEEQNQILIALESMEKLNINTNNLFDKMQTMFNKENINWLDIDFSVWGKDNNHTKIFNTLRQAIMDSRRVQFTYYNSKGEQKIRCVEPLQICFKYNSWYVYSFDIDKQDYRLFKLTRIKDLTLKEDTFKREFIPYNSNYQEDDTIIIKLEIDQNMSYRVYDEFTEEDIDMLDNGNYLVTIKTPLSEWVYGYILSFGASAKVIEPVDIKMEIKNRLKSNLDNYL